MENIDQTMHDKTKEFYKTKNEFLAKFDLKEENTGQIRTFIHKEAEKLLNEFRTKRAEFAKNLQNPTTTPRPQSKGRREDNRFKPYEKSKQTKKDANPFTQQQWKMLKNIFK